MCYYLDCGLPSSELFCEASSLVNRIITPSCIEGVCAEVIVEDIQYCDFGCVEGVCLEYIPECVEDSACGADSYSDNYCSLNGNVVKDFHNIGCVGGGCVDNIIQELVETCYFGCLGGVCLAEVIDKKHDVQLVDDYDGFGNKIRIKDSENNILEDDVPQLYCGVGYDFQFKTKNVGDFVEDVEVNLKINNPGYTLLDDSGLKIGLIAGGETITGNKNNFVFEDVVSGNYVVSVVSSIQGFVDNNPGDNSVLRGIEIICDD